jgi:TolA-binding protein
MTSSPSPQYEKCENLTLGIALFEQGMYDEAKAPLQQATETQERAFGKGHEQTIISKYWLGRTLYEQEKYGEAKWLLEQVVDQQSWLFDTDTTYKSRNYTPHSHYWLGRTLYRLGKISDARHSLLEAVREFEGTIGRDQLQTIDSKYWLGRAFHDEKNYSEAKWLLELAAEGFERIVGKDHEDTLKSKYWSGRTFYELKEYGNAEKPLRQATNGLERCLGRDCKETLESKFWLGCTLYQLEKDSDAEDVFRKAVEGLDIILGEDHRMTQQSKSYLGFILNRQEKYDQAIGPIKQAVEAWRRTPATDRDTKVLPLAVRALDKLQLDSSSLSLPTESTRQTLNSQLNGLFPEGQENRVPYTDLEIDDIARLLKLSQPQWSKVPRTYIVLRTIGHLSLLDKLIEKGFSDYWFPVTERPLPGLIHPGIQAAFFDAQRLVLTKSMGLEKGVNGQHCHFKKGESPPLEHLRTLGQGGFGIVDLVRSEISFKEYARKRVPRPAIIGRRRKQENAMKLFITEIEVLKRLGHEHIIQFIGSYTDSRHVGLLMSPVADMNLKDYLIEATASHHPELRTFFGCLARALQYLHEQRVRHKDIKPQNILVHRGSILFTDFGLSLDYKDAEKSTTQGTVNGYSARHCAPEVLAENGTRNTKSDIWSLGVVFLEMMAVLKHMTVQDMYDFFEQHGSRASFVRTNMDALPVFIKHLKGLGRFADNRAFEWVQDMLLLDSVSRPPASAVFTNITTVGDEEEEKGFCGICCRFANDYSSDSTDELDQMWA